jgi:hypothetical protein
MNKLNKFVVLNHSAGKLVANLLRMFWNIQIIVKRHQRHCVRCQYAVRYISCKNGSRTIPFGWRVVTLLWDVTWSFVVKAPRVISWPCESSMWNLTAMWKHNVRSHEDDKAQCEIAWICESCLHKCVISWQCESYVWKCEIAWRW